MFEIYIDLVRRLLKVVFYFLVWEGIRLNDRIGRLIIFWGMNDYLGKKRNCENGNSGKIVILDLILFRMVV